MLSRFQILIIILFVTCIIVILLCHFVTNIFHICLIKCDSNNEICKYFTYDINGKNKKHYMKTPCVINLWNISHILYFLVLTILFPEYHIFLFCAGVLWEIAESFVGHNNWFDIGWNIIGIILGLVIVKTINKSKIDIL